MKLTSSIGLRYLPEPPYFLRNPVPYGMYRTVYDVPYLLACAYHGAPIKNLKYGIFWVLLHNKHDKTSRQNPKINKGYPELRDLCPYEYPYIYLNRDIPYNACTHFRDVCVTHTLNGHLSLNHFTI